MITERPYLDENGFFQTKLVSTFKKGEEDAFLIREKGRWADGYGNLTGKHYFHLTMGNMLDNQGNRIRPMWRDGDALVFDAFDECSKAGNDLVILKRKEFGFSTIFLGCMPVYYAVMYPNSTSVLTSCDVRRTEVGRSTKLYPYLETTKQLLLNDGDKPVDNGDLIQYIKRGGTNKVGSSTLFVETSKDPSSPSKVAGTRAVYGCLDEMLLHKYATAVQDIISASLNSGLERTLLKNYRGEYDGHRAMFVMGGSCDSMDKSAVEKAQHIIQSSKDGKTKIVFIAAWRCNMQFMENGFSQKDKATKYILDERTRLLEAEKFEKLNMYIRTYPLYISELFDAANKLAFGATIPYKLKESRLSIMNSKIETLTQCDLRRNGSSIEMYPDQEGCYFIRKMPVLGHTYIGGVDSLPFNTENMDDKLSKFCCVIKDITSNEDVAYFIKRDPDVEVIAPLWEKLCLLYSSETFKQGARCMIERNRDSIIQWCKRNFKTHLLARDPENNKEWGVYANNRPGGGGLIDIMNDCLLAYIRVNGLNFIEMINDFEKSSNMKSDLLDAKKIVEYYHSECFRKPASQESKKNMRAPRRLKVDKMGKTYWSYEEEDEYDY